MRKLGATAVRISQGKMSCQGAIIINLALLIFLLHALAWNIPGHMLSGAIAYQILQRERPATIPAMGSILDGRLRLVCRKSTVGAQGRRFDPLSLVRFGAAEVKNARLVFSTRAWW